MSLNFRARFLKLHLEDETTLKSFVEVSNEVRSHNHDALYCLHLFKQNVLKSIHHLFCAMFHILYALSKYGIALVKQKDWCYFAVFAALTVI